MFTQIETCLEHLDLLVATSSLIYKLIKLNDHSVNVFQIRLWNLTLQFNKHFLQLH